MKEVAFYICVPWGSYPVHIWKPKPEHGDLSTDIAFVLAKIGKDAAKIVEGRA